MLSLLRVSRSSPSHGWYSGGSCLPCSVGAWETSTTLLPVQAEDPAYYIPDILRINPGSSCGFQEVQELQNSWALQKQMIDRWLQRSIHSLTVHLRLSNSSAILSRWDQLQTMEPGTFFPWLPHCHHWSIISFISIWPLNSPNCLPRLSYFTEVAS